MTNYFFVSGDSKQKKISPLHNWGPLMANLKRDNIFFASVIIYDTIHISESGQLLHVCEASLKMIVSLSLLSAPFLSHTVRPRPTLHRKHGQVGV